ncbi:hypothetical protein ACFU8W_52330 [Streptomyces sp. NPDC057565]|uniref:hypothetical protein n=1 Tax=Streptomyces sp. NPDC057565 TaxID=3346169 RepID=UPI00368B13CB
MDEDMHDLALWLESKRLMIHPHTDIQVLQRLISEDEDSLLLALYDDISDPRSVAVARAQQRAGGQRRRRLRRLAARGGQATDITC